MPLPAARPPVAGRYATLDGMRGLAAIAVALFHFDIRLMPHGYLAVDFFFALSGFVLWTAYRERWQQGLSVGSFMLRRAMRLYPLFALSILLGGLTALVRLAWGVPGAAGLGTIAKATLFNVTMLPAPVDRPLYPFNVPAWSMFFEIVANLALVTVLLRLPRWGLVLLCAGAAALLAPIVLAAGTGNIGALWSEVGIALLRTAWSFTIGLLVAALGASRHVVPAPAVLAVLAATLLFLFGGLPGVPRGWYDLAGILLLSPLLLYAGCRIEARGRVVMVAAWLGEVSYALYAIHSPLVRLFRQIAAWLGLTLIEIAPVFLAAALALAWAATRWFDIRARAGLQRLAALATNRAGIASSA